ncbi:MAG: hypothetical protein SFW36_01295 [Leptolyngbyaceae cyanobacterium bins.59]|nr:hypothetical protein [Leptolyngbyaceae cyanobacterium bins.59]
MVILTLIGTFTACMWLWESLYQIFYALICWLWPEDEPPENDKDDRL